MEALHPIFTDVVKIGKKGQVTIPKKIRDEDGLHEDDVLTLLHTHGGEIILQKQRIETPEDRMFDAIRRSPKFDWRNAWKEVKGERRRERS